MSIQRPPRLNFVLATILFIVLFIIAAFASSILPAALSLVVLFAWALVLASFILMIYISLN